MLRDEHRIRERISLSLDERHVAPLALAALLLFGAVFALGVFIGKGLAASAPAAAPLGNLDALDARKDAPPARAPAVQVDDSAAHEKERAEAAARKADEDEAKLATQKAAQKAANEKAEKDKAEREKAERERAAKEKAAHEKAREKALAAAAAARGKEPAADEPKGPEGAEGEAASFTVQIGSLPSRAEADDLVARAKERGMEPYVVEADLGEKGTWYRIRVGTWPDKDAAEKFRRGAEKQLGVKALVMPAR